MAGTAKLKLDFTFADDSGRAIEIPNLSPDLDKAELKAKIKAFSVDAVSDTFVSDSGSELSSLVGATYTKLTETEINLKASE